MIAKKTEINITEFFEMLNNLIESYILQKTVTDRCEKEKTKKILIYGQRRMSFTEYFKPIYYKIGRDDSFPSKQFGKIVLEMFNVDFALKDWSLNMSEDFQQYNMHVIRRLLKRSLKIRDLIGEEEYGRLEGNIIAIVGKEEGEDIIL